MKLAAGLLLVAGLAKTSAVDVPHDASSSDDVSISVMRAKYFADTGFELAPRTCKGSCSDAYPLPDTDGGWLDSEGHRTDAFHDKYMTKEEVDEMLNQHESMHLELSCSDIKDHYNKGRCCPKLHADDTNYDEDNEMVKIHFGDGHKYGQSEEMQQWGLSLGFSSRRRLLRGSERGRRLGFFSKAWKSIKSVANTGLGAAGDFIAENGADLAKKYITVDNAVMVAGKAKDMYFGTSGDDGSRRLGFGWSVRTDRGTWGGHTGEGSAFDTAASRIYENGLLGDGTGTCYGIGCIEADSTAVQFGYASGSRRRMNKWGTFLDGGHLKQKWADIKSKGGQFITTAKATIGSMERATVAARPFWKHMCPRTGKMFDARIGPDDPNPETGKLYTEDGHISPVSCLINKRLVTDWMMCDLEATFGIPKTHWKVPSFLEAWCDPVDGEQFPDDVTSVVGHYTSTGIGDETQQFSFGGLLSGASNIVDTMTGTRHAKVDGPKRVTQFTDLLGQAVRFGLKNNQIGAALEGNPLGVTVDELVSKYGVVKDLINTFRKPTGVTGL